MNRIFCTAFALVIIVDDGAEVLTLQVHHDREHDCVHEPKVKMPFLDGLAQAKRKVRGRKVNNLGAIPSTREALVDDLEYFLYIGQVKYSNQILEFLDGAIKSRNNFVINLSDLSLVFMQEIQKETPSDRNYIFTQAETRLFEDFYFAHHYNPAYNFTKKSCAWSSFLLSRYLVPNVELQP